MCEQKISVVWLGTGKNTEFLLRYLNRERVQIIFFVDKNLSINRSMFNRFPIVEIDKLSTIKYDYLFVEEYVDKLEIQKFVQYNIEPEKIVQLDLERSLYDFCVSQGKIFSNSRFYECIDRFLINNEIIKNAFNIDEVIKNSPWIKKASREWDILRAISVQNDGSIEFIINSETKTLARLFSGYMVSYAHHADDILIYKAFNGMRGGFYIDVGAGNPVMGSYTKKLYDELSWNGINIDPRKNEMEKYDKVRERDANYCIAVSNKKTKSLFFEKAGSSTLDEENALRLGIDKFQQRYVDTTTINDILDTHVIETIHLLKIDCEASEAKVLQGLDLVRYRPWMLSIESTLPHTSIPSHEQWEDGILRHGYVFFQQNFDNRIYVLREKYDFFQHNLSKNAFVLSVSYETVQKIHDHIQGKESENNIYSRIAALSGREVYFIGYGAAYEAYKHLFAATLPRAVLVDMIPDSGLPETVDGLPVRHADEVLPAVAAKGEVIPLVIFSRKAWASEFVGRVARAYPAFAGDNIVLCTL